MTIAPASLTLVPPADTTERELWELCHEFAMLHPQPLIQRALGLGRVGMLSWEEVAGLMLGTETLAEHLSHHPLADGGCTCADDVQTCQHCGAGL